MSRLFLGILIYLSLTSSAQTITQPDSLASIRVTNTFFAIPGKTYVDSVEMDLSKTYLDPDNIKQIKSFKRKGERHLIETKSATLITRRKQNSLVSLADIRLESKVIIDTSLPTVYVIDGVLVDTVSVKMELSTITSVDIIKSSTNPGLSHNGEKNVFVVTTKNGKRKKNGY